MRKIAAAEMLNLRELLLMESNAVAKAKTMQGLVKDDEFAVLVESGIQAGEARIKGIQQFLTENKIIDVEVH